MKKLFCFAVMVMVGMVCYGQQPTQVKPIKTVESNAEVAQMNKMKKQMMNLIAQYNKQMKAAQETMDKIEDLRKELTAKMKDAEAKDRMGNFEIQDLMSTYNQAETLSSNVIKKLSDSKNAVINKIN